MPYATPELRREGRRRSYARDSSRIDKYEKERRKEKPEAFRAIQLKRRYGMSLDDFDQMLKAQGGLCALCLTKPAVDVDHCHSNGKVRALLCRACNLGLGMFSDKPEMLRKAASYIEANRDGD
jgi:hypothetical protein